MVAQARKARSQKASSPIKYVIVANKIDPTLGRGDEDRRFVEILINPRSFSKVHLKKVFGLISKRFPEPRLLFVNVFSNLDDVQTPEERERGAIAIDPPPATKTAAKSVTSRINARATFVRRNDGYTRLIVHYPSGASEIEEFKSLR